MSNIKVLTHHFDAGGWSTFRKFDDEQHLYHTFGNARRFEPVFNRSGWYRRDKMSWYEVVLPSGKLIAVEDVGDMLSYSLRVIHEGERSISPEQWGLLNKLIREKVLPVPEWYQYFEQHLNQRRITRDMNLRFIPTKKRLKAMKKEKALVKVEE